MKKVPNIPWWASKAMAKPEPAPDTDYADMGTAFGLDASLGADANADSAAEPLADGEAGPPADRLNRRSVL